MPSGFVQIFIEFSAGWQKKELLTAPACPAPGDPGKARVPQESEKIGTFGAAGLKKTEFPAKLYYYSNRKSKVVLIGFSRISGAIDALRKSCFDRAGRP
jgi:hypothetical protein